MVSLFRAAGSLCVTLGILCVSGCSSRESEAKPEPATPSYPGVKLKVGAVDDAALLTGVISQKGEWEASRGGEVGLRDQGPVTLDKVGEVDILLFSAQRLGDLVDAGLLEIIENSVVVPAPRPDADNGDRSDDAGGGSSAAESADTSDNSSERPEDAFEYMDIAPVFRDQVVRYGTDRFGLPLGGSALVLVYRGDAFKREANIAAARAQELTLEPPSTWTKLDSLAKFFQGRDWDGDGKPDFGIGLAMAADPEGVANTVFLARAASLGQHPDHFSMLFDTDKMVPRIEGPPFVEALRSLVALKELGPPGMDRFDAAAAREAFRSGKVALLIDRAERASTWSSGRPVSVAPLPGSERVFEPSRKIWETPSSPNKPSYLPLGGGWLVGVRRGLEGIQQRAAIDFAKYLANPENSNRIRAERAFPMLPVRTTQMSQGLPDPTSAPDVDVRLWGDAVRRTLLTDRVVPGLRIPQAQDYLDELAKGRVAAVGGEAPERALEGVAKAWAVRTEAFGKRRQVWHYRRSLNKLMTSDQPPERGK